VRSLVTIAIPTYQRAAQLRRAIESVLAQEYEPVELVIADNASTDGTRELCEDYTARHPSVRYVRHATNVGPTANFQHLRTLARGDYFLFLGDDDWIDPGYVAACVAAIEDNPGTSLAAGRVVYHGPDGLAPDPYPVDIDDADPRRRVLRYCRGVRANGVFYGVVPTLVDLRVPVMRNVLGGDWLHVMALAYLGPVRTLDGVVVHRTVGGTTLNLANVSATLGLGWLPRNAPQVAIVYSVFRDIAVESPLYAGLGRRGRLWLGARAGAILFVRFVPGAVVKFVRMRATGARSRSQARPAPAPAP
jgi:glycosyltransferase involved in cell wall biosynthesis